MRSQKFIKGMMFFGALLMSGAVWAQAAPYQDGVHYTTFDQAPSGRKQENILVTEIFSYGCHACNEFEPFIQAWKNRQGEDVSFSRLPVGFGRPTWNMLAQGYVMAEVLGVADETHVPLMDAIWKQGLWNRGTQIRSVEQLADFYETQGVDRAKFLALDNGFALSMRQSNNEKKLQTYQPRQTPTMIVADKYRVQTGQNVPSFQAMLAIVDYLVSQERVAMNASNTAAEAAVDEGDAAAESVE